MREKLLDAFEKGINQIFSDEMIFAFISGSVARKKENPHSDIDMFIVVEYIDQAALNHFREWYTKIHETFALVPDMEYPGEVVSDANLHNSLRMVIHTHPTKIITAKELYDGIVWAGMLISPNVGFMGSKRVFELHKEKAFEICKKWVNELGLKHADNEALDILLKTHITYDPCGN